MNSQEHKENSIRFIDSGYNEKFRVNDGDKILIHTRNGTTLERECIRNCICRTTIWSVG